MKNRGNRRYKFTDKSQSVGGIFSFVFALSAIGLITAAVIISYRNKGSAGPVIGLFGITALFLSVIGLYTGIKSFQEEEIFYHFSWIGSIINAVVLIVMILLVLIGL